MKTQEHMDGSPKSSGAPKSKRIHFFFYTSEEVTTTEVLRAFSDTGEAESLPEFEDISIFEKEIPLAGGQKIEVYSSLVFHFNDLTELLENGLVDKASLYFVVSTPDEVEYLEEFVTNMKSGEVPCGEFDIKVILAEPIEGINQKIQKIMELHPIVYVDLCTYLKSGLIDLIIIDICETVRASQLEDGSVDKVAIETLREALHEDARSKMQSFSPREYNLNTSVDSEGSFVSLASESYSVRDSFLTVKEGWLKKKSPHRLNLFNKYQRRYCTLANGKMKYFAKKSDIQPRGVIDFMYYDPELRLGTKENEMKLTYRNFEENLSQFKASGKNENFRILLLNKSEVEHCFEFQTESIEETEAWIHVLIDHINFSQKLKIHGGRSSFQLGSEVVDRRRTELHNSKFWKFEFMSFYRIAEEGQTGDLILVRQSPAGSSVSVNSKPKDQKYTEIGILIRVKTDILYILKLADQEVKMYSLEEFQEIYHRPINLTNETLSYRKLTHTQGEGYMKSLEKLYIDLTVNDWSRLPFQKVPEKSNLDRRGQMAAQVIAACYREFGLLKEGDSLSGYQPSSFSSGKKLKLKNDATLGPEYIIEFDPTTKFLV